VHNIIALWQGFVTRIKTKGIYWARSYFNNSTHEAHQQLNHDIMNVTVSPELANELLPNAINTAAWQLYLLGKMRYFLPID